MQKMAKPSYPAAQLSLARALEAKGSDAKLARGSRAGAPVDGLSPML